MKIIVDAMGGDNAPGEIVKGAILAAEELRQDIILAGRTETLLKVIETMGLKELPKGIEIANATEVVEMEDDPSTAVKTKTDSSMAVGLRLLRDGQGAALVSAGNTGALLTGATLLVKRIPGIRRAAMAPVIPNKGPGVLLIDCGANVECTKEHLLQFAFMGSFYAGSILGLEAPRVGLLNIGTEDTKGGILQKETYALLQDASRSGRIRFVGNVEGRDVMLGGVDVVVADGFTGNVLLKAIEGAAVFFTDELKGIFTKNAVTQLAAAAVGSGLRAFKKKLDASEVGGTALLGISKPVIKAHGNSDAPAIRSAVRQAIKMVSTDMTAQIEANMEYIKLS